jgi:hypothetical protein
MKKLLILGALLLSLTAHAGIERVINSQGKWVTTIPMTKMDADFIDVMYTFTGDSLYIDTYPSGCSLAQMSMSKFESTEDGFKCDAIDTLYDVFKGHKIHEKLYHLEFKRDKTRRGEILRVYRDDTLVDIIKRFP